MIRPMKWGEVGCFLSHYQIWIEIIEKKLKLVLILEDDAEFMIDGEQFDFYNFHHDLNASLEEFMRQRGELLLVFF